MAPHYQLKEPCLLIAIMTWQLLSASRCVHLFQPRQLPSHLFSQENIIISSVDSWRGQRTSLCTLMSSSSSLPQKHPNTVPILNICNYLTLVDFLLLDNLLSILSNYIFSRTMQVWTLFHSFDLLAKCICFQQFCFQ